MEGIYKDDREVLAGRRLGPAWKEEILICLSLLLCTLIIYGQTINFKFRVYSRICGWVTSLTRGNRVGEHKEKSGRCPESRSSTAGGAGRCFLCIWD